MARDVLFIEHPSSAPASEETRGAASRSPRPFGATRKRPLAPRSGRSQHLPPALASARWEDTQHLDRGPRLHPARLPHRFAKDDLTALGRSPGPDLYPERHQDTDTPYWPGVATFQGGVSNRDRARSLDKARGSQRIAERPTTLDREGGGASGVVRVPRPTGSEKAGYRNALRLRPSLICERGMAGRSSRSSERLPRAPLRMGCAPEYPGRAVPGLR
jgi:hypothetical protein